MIIKFFSFFLLIVWGRLCLGGTFAINNPFFQIELISNNGYSHNSSSDTTSNFATNDGIDIDDDDCGDLEKIDFKNGTDESNEPMVKHVLYLLGQDNLFRNGAYPNHNIRI